MSGVSIRILDAGEVAIRSPSMLASYVDDEADAELLDGHFLTGDLGTLTADGALVITGRTKLLIDVGGLKVNPLEVEAAIETHPEVRECIVVPLPQSETVSRLRAIVIPRDAAAAPTVDALRGHARSRLAPYKVPRVFEFRDELPRSATGKVLRAMLDPP
jgi:acyl-CoA synthetase (AMP-forming)/AMP-acid ligase II